MANMVALVHRAYHRYIVRNHTKPVSIQWSTETSTWAAGSLHFGTTLSVHEDSHDESTYNRHEKSAYVRLLARHPPLLSFLAVDAVRTMKTQRKQAGKTQKCCFVCTTLFALTALMRSMIRMYVSTVQPLRMFLSTYVQWGKGERKRGRDRKRKRERGREGDRDRDREEDRETEGERYQRGKVRSGSIRHCVFFQQFFALCLSLQYSTQSPNVSSRRPKTIKRHLHTSTGHGIKCEQPESLRRNKFSSVSTLTWVQAPPIICSFFLGAAKEKHYATLRGEKKRAVPTVGFAIELRHSLNLRLLHLFQLISQKQITNKQNREQINKVPSAFFFSLSGIKYMNIH